MRDIVKKVVGESEQKNLKRAIARVDCFTFAYFAQISGSFDLLNALR